METHGVYEFVWPEMRYIGVKSWSEVNDMPGKGYWSSSKYVHEYRAEHGDPIVYIRSYHHTRQAANHAERVAQIAWDAANNPLYLNRTNGMPSHAGCAHTDETKRKISEAKKGKTPWNKGKPMPVETRKKQSKAKSGENNPNWGKKLSEDHRRKLSESRKGENNPNWGKSFSEEWKQKMSASRKSFLNREKYAILDQHMERLL